MLWSAPIQPANLLLPYFFEVSGKHPLPRDYRDEATHTDSEVLRFPAVALDLAFSIVFSMTLQIQTAKTSRFIGRFPRSYRYSQRRQFGTSLFWSFSMKLQIQTAQTNRMDGVPSSEPCSLKLQIQTARTIRNSAELFFRLCEFSSGDLQSPVSISFLILIRNSIQPSVCPATFSF